MKKYIYLAIAIVALVFLNSCKDSSTEITDLDYITLDEFSKNLVVNENSSLDTEFKIFTSKKMDSDTTINLDITTSMAAGNYTIPTSVTIAKGSNEATIPVKLTDTSLNRMGETMSISFDAKSGTFAGVSKVDLKISVLCPSDLAGSWTYSDGNRKTVTITANGGGKYRVPGDNRFTSNYYFGITDACSNITVTPGQLDAWGYKTSGTGTVSADKRTITLSYTADGLMTNRTMTLVKN